MSWIKVVDALPEPMGGCRHSTEVLVWTYRCDLGYYDHERGAFFGHSDGNFGGDGQFDDPVTHWMPLPAGPDVGDRHG